MEIDVENVDVNFDWLDTTLTQNGYYEIGEDEETGEFKPVLIPDWQEGDDYDIKVEVPEPTPTTPTFISTEINQNGKYEMVEGQNGWQPEIVQNPDPQENYDLEINVPQTITNPLETLTNKRIYSEGVVTISDLMTNPLTNQGITKESTLNVDLYIPDVRFNPITNNNTDYTLGQLTQDPQEYFTRNSIVKANISPKILLDFNKFKINTNTISLNYSSGSSSGISIPLNQYSSITLVIRMNDLTNIHSIILYELYTVNSSFNFEDDWTGSYYYYTSNGYYQSQSYDLYNDEIRIMQVNGYSNNLTNITCYGYTILYSNSLIQYIKK